MNIVIFLILGAATSLIFPPYFFLPIGFIVFPFLCIFFDKNNLVKIKKINLFFYSFSFSFSFFLMLLFWIKNPFFVFDETKNYFLLSIFFIFLLGLIFSSIFTIVIKFNKIIPIIHLIPIIFILVELVISIFLYGFPWISFAVIISTNNILTFIPEYCGSFVTSFLILQIFCLPYIFIKNKINYRELIIFLIFLIPLLIIITFSYISSNNNNYDKIKLDLEIFQLNFKKNIFNPEDRLKVIINNIKNSNAELLVFAENNYPYLVKNNELKKIQNILKNNQTVVIGATSFFKNNYYNTLFNISPTAITSFDKKILVPFGEFLPLRSLLNFFEPISGSHDYLTGTKERIIKFDNKINYIPVICYEIIFYWKLIDNLNFKSPLIINITNDIWFGKYIGPYQHFYLTKLRASEFNKPIIRASNNGISGIILPDGEIILPTKLNINKTIRYEIDLGKNHNNYRL